MKGDEEPWTYGTGTGAIPLSARRYFVKPYRNGWPSLRTDQKVSLGAEHRGNR